ncbi:MAG: VWA domain-containing protein [Planctomycetales bacterium]|nr:VWA domain-containing protein [Planctomycetales bacterium]
MNYHIAFDSPWYLCLLLLLPALWVAGMKTLAGLGKTRRLVALVLRSVVLIALVLALAEAQLVRSTDRLTVIYLLDQSLSIPEAQRRAMIQFVNSSIARHRDAKREDRAGVIVFGREASVEVPPIDDEVPVPMSIESLIDRNHTDLSGAMKMALAMFPHDAAKRVVLVTDGNETLGDAQTQASALADAGVSIDVVPIQLEARGDVSIEKLALSSDVRRGQPFQLRVVLNHTTPAGDAAPPVKGRLKVTRHVGEIEEVVTEEAVTLEPGKKVYSLTQDIEDPGFYTYEARFVPDDVEADELSQNNRATAFTHIRGRGSVLLIEDWAPSEKGRFDHLVQRLRAEDLEVTMMASDRLFTNLSELQNYDTVVLANVPRSSGSDTSDVVQSFSDDQIKMLVANTQQLGSGLVMIGGPNSFGAGGWTGTELEKAMPVDFQIKNAKVEAVGALALIMHAGEMADGNYWQKVVARESIKALGPQDYCGLIHWNGNDEWLWNHPRGFGRVGEMRKIMLRRLDGMTPGDMPQFDGSMLMAAKAFQNLPDAAVKHMIIISDGDPTPPSPSTLALLRRVKVRVSTVAVGSHGMLGSNLMQQIASATGGKYYVVKQASALPKIYQREVRRLARPLIFEDKNGIKPFVKYPHEMIKGVADDIPPLTGFVMTTLKDNPLVEVALVSPKPPGEKNATILAGWTYGLGRAVALTTDAGQRWTTGWTGWANYDKLFSQIVRWSMRPVGDTGKFSVATDVVDGRGRVVITALDKEDEFLNFLDMAGSVVGPDMKPAGIEVRQVAPGRYIGQFDANAAGSYFVMVNPGPGHAPIRTGANVSYSAEFRAEETNAALLEQIAALAPHGGEAGKLLTAPAAGEPLDALLQMDPFRRDLPKSTASDDVWPLLLVFCSTVFFFDVLNRRVHLDPAWLAPYTAWVKEHVFGRAVEKKPDATMSRLRSRKAAVSDELAQRRASARFEPEADAAVADAPLAADAGATETQSAAPPPPRETLAAEKKEETYTERLLKAKKDATKRRQ